MSGGINYYETLKIGGVSVTKVWRDKRPYLWFQFEPDPSRRRGTLERDEASFHIPLDDLFTVLRSGSALLEAKLDTVDRGALERLEIELAEAKRQGYKP